MAKSSPPPRTTPPSTSAGPSNFGADASPTKQVPNWLIAALVLFGFLAVLVLLCYSVFTTESPIVRYRFLIVSLGFMLATISCLLLSQQHVRVEGHILFASFTLIGSASMWIIVSIILSWLFPESTILADLSRVQSETATMQVESALGWQSYDEWLEELGPARGTIAEIEEHTINEFLPSVFYHGPTNTQRLVSPHIDTVFVYLNSRKPPATLKLQAFSGDKPSNGTPSVYLPAATSTPDGGATSWFFAFENDALTAEAVTHGEWRKVPSDDRVTALLVTLYENDERALGDYVQIDVPKYLSVVTSAGIHITDASLDRAQVSLALLSGRPIVGPSLWEMANSRVAERYPAPLIFHRERAKFTNNGDLSQLQPVLERVSDRRFGSSVNSVTREAATKYLDKIDELLREDRGAKDLVLKDIVNPAKCQFPGRLYTAVSDAEEVLISVFRWGESVKEPK